MVETANYIWRDWNTDGVPASQISKPEKRLIREWGTWVEALLGSGSSGGTWYATRALMNADLAHDAGTLGIVYADPNPALNGMYVKQGASGSGSWTQISNQLPTGSAVVAATVTGGGANALTVSFNPNTQFSPGQAIYILRGIAADNTGPVTINGKPWRTNVGNEFVAGGIKAGGIYLFLDNGTHYRAVTDQDVSALVAAAEQAAADAVAAAGSVEFPVSYGVPQSLSPSQRQQAQENIGSVSYSAGMFGAKGDGEDESSIFDAIDDFRPQHHINLGGRSYLVDEVPNGASYFNGSWDVAGQEVISASPNPKPHPWTGNVIVTAEYPGTFFSAGIWLDPDTNVLWRAEVVMERHDGTSGARLDIMRSIDCGATWRDRRTIFADPAHPRVRAGAFGLMNNGRFGGVVTTGDLAREQWFVWSDDKGATWSFLNITADMTVANQFVYGMLLPGPSGDADDWMVASYIGTLTAKVIRTLDNGATWADHVLIGNDGLPGTNPYPGEPSIVHVPGRGWIMFVRVETNPVGEWNMYVSTSADFIAWSPWVDSGIMLGQNPVHALYDGGKVHISMFHRTDFGGVDRPDILFCYSADARAVFDDPALLGKVGPVEIAALPSRALGYMQSCRLPDYPGDKTGPWFHIMKSEGRSSTARLTHSMEIVISDIALPARGQQYKSEVIQLVENPIFSSWPRGQSFAASTANRGTAGRWSTTSQGQTASIAVERVTLSAAQSLRFPFKPSYGLRIDRSAGGAFAGIRQMRLGEDAQRAARKFLSSGEYILRLYGLGEFPDVLRGAVIINGAATSVLLFNKVPSGQTAGWVVEASMQMITTPPEISSITSMQLSIDSNTDTSAYDITLVGVFLYPKICAASMEFAEPNDTDQRVSRYCRNYSGNSRRIGQGNILSATSARVVIPLDPPMAGASTVTVQSPSDWVVESSSDYAVSAMTGSSSAHTVVLSPTITGAVDGFAMLRAGSATAGILVDTGY